VDSTVVVASYRTRLEAELALRLLEAMDIPCVINSAEGMLHGPLAPGATVSVRTGDAGLAREVLAENVDAEPPSQAACAARCPTPEDAARVAGVLRDAGIPAFERVGGDTEERQTRDVFVRRAHAERARILLDRAGESAS